jgi:hypothetical protein
MVGFGVCNLMLGPTSFLGLNTSPYAFHMQAASLHLMGVFMVMFNIPNMPEMLERLRVDLGIKEGEDEAIDERLNDIVNES